VILPDISAGNTKPPLSVDNAEFPPAPKGKVGWPWDSPSRPLPMTQDWPSISIVTPSFNQGEFLEETIRSVLLQGYPNLQYIVIDGGSSDDSLSILRKYAPWLAYWVSEADRGQPHAINKGLAVASGSLFGFINSDDLLLPGALLAAGAAHAKAPHSLVAGDVIEFREPTANLQRVRQTGLEFETFVQLWKEVDWHQPGIFIPRELFHKIGNFDESLQFGFDYEFLCRALRCTDVCFLDEPVAMFRLHVDSKTTTNYALQVREQLRISRRYWHCLGKVDRAGYRRFAAERLFCAGLSRLLHGRDQALNLILEGFVAQPVWAVTVAARQLPAWILSFLHRQS